MSVYNPDIGASINQEDTGSSTSTQISDNWIQFLLGWDGQNDGSVDTSSSVNNTDDLICRHIPGTDFFAVGTEDGSDQPICFVVKWDGATLTVGSAYVLEATVGGVNFIEPHPDSDKFVIGWDDDTVAVIEFNTSTLAITTEGTNYAAVLGTGRSLSVDLKGDHTKLAVFDNTATPTWYLLEPSAGSTTMTVTSKSTFGTAPALAPSGYAVVGRSGSNATLVEVAHATDHIDIYPVTYTDSTETLARGSRQEVDIDNETIATLTINELHGVASVVNDDGTGAVMVPYTGRYNSSYDYFNSFVTWYWNGTTLVPAQPENAGGALHSPSAPVVGSHSSSVELRVLCASGRMVLGGEYGKANAAYGHCSAVGLNDNGALLQSGYVKEFDTTSYVADSFKAEMNRDNYNVGLLFWNRGAGGTAYRIQGISKD